MENKAIQKPMIGFEITEGATPEQVKVTITGLTGERPEKAEDLGNGKWALTFGSREAVQKVQILHGRSLQGVRKKVEIFHIDQKITVDEIFEKVKTKFHIKDKQELMRSFKETPMPRNNRYGRKVTAKTNFVQG